MSAEVLVPLVSILGNIGLGVLLFVAKGRQDREVLLGSSRREPFSDYLEVAATLRLILDTTDPDKQLHGYDELATRIGRGTVGELLLRLEQRRCVLDLLAGEAVRVHAYRVSIVISALLSMDRSDQDWLRLRSKLKEATEALVHAGRHELDTGDYFADPTRSPHFGKGHIAWLDEPLSEEAIEAIRTMVATEAPRLPKSS